MQKLLRQLTPLLLALNILLVFVLGVTGFHISADINDFESEWHLILSTVYATLSMFIMESADPAPENWQVITARFLAALLLGYGIFATIYNFMRREITLLRIKYFYRNHFVVFGAGKIGYQLARELLQAGKQVVVIDRDEENDGIQRVRQHGGLVVIGSAFDRDDVLRTGLARAQFCAILLGNDEANLKLSNFLMRLSEEGVFRGKVRVLAHIDNWYANNFLNDYLDLYNRNNYLDFSPFNADIIGAQSIYDQFPPLSGVHYEVKQEGETVRITASENTIAVIGYNETTEAFLLENIILSHCPGGQKLNVLLIEPEAEKYLKNIYFKFPFVADYLNVIPVVLHDENFYDATFRQPEFLRHLRMLSGAYVFGDDDAYLMGLANNFKQLLYAETGDTTQVPVVVCLPENSAVISLLEPQQHKKGEQVVEETVLNKFQQSFNINLFRLITETCTKDRLIDQIGEMETLAKTVNYFYSLLYDTAHRLPEAKQAGYQALLPELQQAFIEKTFRTSQPLLELEEHLLEKICQHLQLDKNQWRAKISVEARWKDLSGLKQLSNRYVARHLNVKVDFLKKIGHTEFSPETIKPFFKVLAPVEHDRWTAEKLAYKFRFGPFPKDKKQKKLLKDTLKIHDQIIPYEELNQEMEDKDFNMFLLIPVMQRIRTRLRQP